MRASSVIVVAVSFFGGLSFVGEAFGSYVVTHRHPARVTDEVRVERENGNAPSSMTAFESAAEPEPTRAPVTTKVAGATWSSNGKLIPFDRDAAIGSLRPIVDLLGVCRVQGATRGEGTATVVFMGTGRVLLVTLDAPYKQTAVGACVERRLAHAETPVFDADPQPVKVRFTL